MVVYVEACRFHVQLLPDVLAELDQVRTALTELARLELMMVLNARQFRRQRLAAGALTWRFYRCVGFEVACDLG